MEREQMKTEAVKRMKMMHIMPEVIDAFEENGTVEVSEKLNNIFNAILYFSDNYEGLNEEIRRFEEEYEGLVYHVQLLHTVDFGDMFSFFYVSKYEEEWERDIEEIENGFAYVYVYNSSIPEYSELGIIMFKPSMGGVLRIA